MQRKDFLRLVGGGVVYAAVPGLACASQGATRVGNGPEEVGSVISSFPADTVVAWRGPTAAVGRDPRRVALAYAILAPNPHNLQPWLVDLREDNVVTVYHDRSRLLPETDPFGRQILIGHGAFIELLTQGLSQQGFATRVSLFPHGEPASTLPNWDGRPIARIELAAPGSADPDPLFAQVLKRRTPKSAFDMNRPLTTEALSSLIAAGRSVQVASDGTIKPDRCGRLRQLCRDAAQVETRTPRTVMESLRLTRIGPSEIREQPDGISINSPVLRVLTALGLYDRSVPPKEGSQGYKAMMNYYEVAAGTAMGFVWLSTSGNSRVEQVQAGAPLCGCNWPPPRRESACTR